MERPLVVDTQKLRVFLGGNEVVLTKTEFKILSTLAGSVGCVVSYGEILSKVWGINYSTETHILQVNIGRLRKKIGGLIYTYPGVGYMLKECRSD